MAVSGGSADTKRVFGVVLGYLVTLGACVTKAPQIYKCLKADSAAGLSLSSNYLETNSLMSKLIYHR